MPLFIWHTELDWPSFYLIAKSFPDLPLVVETQVQKILYHTRPLFALMRYCRNVSLELSNFAGQGFVEYACRELGAGRLIFGSFLPVNDPLVAMGMVIEAEISREEKALIARENLRRLIGEA
jgi:predicted TIM-barrel fold metal-dependent hydrolase